MKKKVFDLSIFVVVLVIICILFSACGIGNGVDTDESTTNPVTNQSTTKQDTSESTTTPENITDEITVNSDDDVLQVSYMECVVAPDPKESPYLIEYIGTDNYITGYLYIDKGYHGEYKVLLAKKIKYENFAEMKNYVYVITEDNEVVKVNKNDGSYKTVYKSQYGSISRISLFNYENKYIFFNDGEYIVRLDPSDDESEVITQINKELYMIIAGGNVEKTDNSVYCNICGNGKEFFLIIDTDYNYYWYHPETDKIELVDSDYLYYKSVEDWNPEGITP